MSAARGPARLGLRAEELRRARELRVQEAVQELAQRRGVRRAAALGLRRASEEPGRSRFAQGSTTEHQPRGAGRAGTAATKNERVLQRSVESL